MRIACVLISHFPVAAELRRDPALKGRPLVIGETPDQRKNVLDCSSEAEAQGVRAGMPLRQALALCREVVFLPSHPAHYSDVFDSVLEALESFSPEVEPASLGRAYLNVDGLARHYQGELDLGERIIRSLKAATGLVSGVGVAKGKFAAWSTAVTSEPGQVCTVPEGKESEFLQPLDVSLLPASPDTLRRLDLYGLHTMGELASLAPGPLQAQFGSEGMRLWELSRGIDNEPLRPHRREEVMSETLRFPTAAVSVEALTVACRRLLTQLHWRLHGRAARRLRLRAALWGGRRAGRRR